MAGALRRILVIEDDAETATQIVGFLTTHGYEADLAVNGRDGLRLGETAQYAVITIDRMLPVMDGLAIIRRLREAGVTTPALIISALGEVDDRVRGLRAGGDDYLVKPFAFAELLARLEVLARCGGDFKKIPGALDFRDLLALLDGDLDRRQHLQPPLDQSLLGIVAFHHEGAVFIDVDGR